MRGGAGGGDVDGLFAHVSFTVRDNSLLILVSTGVRVRILDPFLMDTVDCISDSGHC